MHTSKPPNLHRWTRRPTPPRRSKGGWAARGVLLGAARPGCGALAGVVALGLLSIGWLACAAPPRVESVVLVPGANVAGLETFFVVPPDDATSPAHVLVTRAIERELTRLGKTPAPREDADMWLVYRASALDRQKERVSSDPDANAMQVVGYVEGTLAIDVFDDRGARRIWHGQAVFDANTRKDLEREVDPAVRAILAELTGA